MPRFYRRLVDQISSGNGWAMLLYGLIHGLAVLLGQIIAEPTSGVWPAVGVQAAFLIVAPTSRWVAMLTSAVLIEDLLSVARYSPYTTGMEMLREFPYAAIDAITATLIAVIYRRLCGQVPPNLRTAFLALTGILGVLVVDSVMGTAWLNLAAYEPWWATMWN